MPTHKLKLSSKSAYGYTSANKDRRKIFNVRQKKARDALKRDETFRRKREEDKNPKLREERLAKNKPKTLDSKRVWDDALGEDGEDMLGLAVDLEAMSKRRKTEGHGDDTAEGLSNTIEDQRLFDDNIESDVDSMLEDEEEEEAETEDEDGDEDQSDGQHRMRAPSPVTSTMSTKMDLTPEALSAKFPTLFEPPREPKILVTTSLNSTLHDQAQLLTTMFPNCNYVRRSAHRFSHKYSVREISNFASNRGYTTLVILNEDQKHPCGLDVVHLPSGPMFHFSMKNWVEGRKLPGHGNPTNHYPEIILNNFRTPLGLLTAHLFHTMFPPRPELQGRQVVTLHNQRDFIFVRRHRYIFRDKRPTEKSVVDADGKPVKGVEEIRAGLQELGPRFTLKLRRIDRGIQHKSGGLWQWKGKTDRVRTKFQL
jgi:ribosome production factor 1